MRLPFQRKNQPAAARDSPKPLRSDAFLLEAMDAWGDVVYRVALAQTGSPSDPSQQEIDDYLGKMPQMPKLYNITELNEG